MNPDRMKRQRLAAVMAEAAKRKPMPLGGWDLPLGLPRPTCHEKLMEHTGVTRPGHNKAWEFECKTCGKSKWVD